MATPRFSKKVVNRAGATLIDEAAESDEWDHALDVISNWRASHNFPLNTFQTGLRRRARAIEADAIVAQRIKRLASIAQKLERFPTMTLSQMQDIGGCRAVMASVPNVRKLVRSFLESQIKHQLHQRDDYIAAPKDSGYRGVHLIYRYFSDRKQTYNSLKIELQIRTQLQHAWATAVETAGSFQRQALKSSAGDKDWLRFFSLAGSAFAVHERTTLVPDTPTNYRDLILELREYAHSLDLIRRLQTYGDAMNIVQSPQQRGASYFLLEMNPSTRMTQVTGFKFGESKLAAKKYTEVEQKIRHVPGGEAVLVSVDTLDSLRKAYPNYFLDTHMFIRYVERSIRTLRQPKRARTVTEQKSLFD